MSLMTNKIEKLAIANRGEVAVRIVRAARELGIKTVLLHSDADVNTLAYRMADETILIGTGPAHDSYLNIAKNINAAKSAEADAIHPGFGFLSENAELALACEKARLIFVGPTAESIRLFGDKISAKNLVKNIGVPLIPGYQGEDQSDSVLMDRIREIGFPVMVKVAGGGGGRGLRIVREQKEVAEALVSARREGLSAFGSDRLLIEKYFENAKHIEIQVFGDGAGKVYHLFERECSVQRRHQKMIEEGPASNIDPHLRLKMQKSAIEIAAQVNYRGAGTVEFLYQDGEFYFMEMNTRLQVEHPVTESVLGVDLVKAQLSVAQGQGVLWTQDELIPRGHAIECRINAENAYSQGVPSIGVLSSSRFPMGPGIRADIGFESGDEVTEFYDSMIAKIIVHDETRFRAIRKMIQALKETVIFGIKTNIPLLIKILEHPEFVEGKMSTQFIAKYFPKGLVTEEVSEDDKELADLVRSQLRGTPNYLTSKSPWTAEWKK
jgi:3-methylcrotonyl-CoA carboxylase alpha subunit